MCADQSRDKTNQRKKLKESNLGIRAQVSDAQAIAFSFPHQATALQQKYPPILKKLISSLHVTLGSNWHLYQVNRLQKQKTRKVTIIMHIVRTIRIQEVSGEKDCSRKFWI